MTANFKIFMLTGEITWESVSDLTVQIYDAYFGEEQVKNFVIPIMSQGGDCDGAWSLYAVLRNLDANIATLAMGRVYSAGIIPYLAGDIRYAFKESLFLFHPTTIEHQAGEVSPIYRLNEEIEGEKYDRLIFKRILSTIVNTRHKKEIDNLAHESKSCFLDATEAKKYGIVSHIINNPDEIIF